MEKYTNKLIVLAQDIDKKYDVLDENAEHSPEFMSRLMPRLDKVGEDLTKMSVLISDLNLILPTLNDIVSENPNSPEYDFYVALHKLVEAYDQAFDAYDELHYAK